MGYVLGTRLSLLWRSCLFARINIRFIVLNYSVSCGRAKQQQPAVAEEQEEVPQRSNDRGLRDK